MDSAKIKKLNGAIKNENVSESSKEKMDVKKAEEIIQQKIILNAWRREKEKNIQLQEDVKTFSLQVEGLQLQIYALKHLLEGEKTRLVLFNSDLRKVLKALEECKHEKHLLEKEREQMECRVHAMEERLTRVEMECKNQKNELVTARNEARTWEKQLEKEREKLSIMKDERKFFMEEVRFKGNLLVWQIRSFEQFAEFFNDTRTKSNNPALPWDKLIRRNDGESEKQKTLKKQQSLVILENLQESPELKSVRLKMERKTPEEEEKIEELEKSILGKTDQSSLVPYYPQVS